MPGAEKISPDFQPCFGRRNPKSALKKPYSTNITHIVINRSTKVPSEETETRTPKKPRRQPTINSSVIPILYRITKTPSSIN